MGAGVSVTRFFIAPLVTFDPINWNSPSLLLFYARATVMGAGVSVTRFFIAPLVTFDPIN
jgi:hypothetical protein